MYKWLKAAAIGNGVVLGGLTTIHLLATYAPYALLGGLLGGLIAVITILTRAVLDD